MQHGYLLPRQPKLAQRRPLLFKAGFPVLCYGGVFKLPFLVGTCLYLVGAFPLAPDERPVMPPELPHLEGMRPVCHAGYRRPIGGDADRVVRVGLLRGEELPYGSGLPAGAGIHGRKQFFQFLQDERDRLVQDGCPGIALLFAFRGQLYLVLMELVMAVYAQAAMLYQRSLPLSPLGRMWW